MPMYPTHWVSLTTSLSRYDIFAVNIASTMLGYPYGHAKGPALNSAQDLGIKIATPIGTLMGRLVFGWLGDVVGRKRIFSLVSISTFLCLSIDGVEPRGHHRRYCCSSSRRKCRRCRNYCCFGYLAFHSKLTSFFKPSPSFLLHS